MTIKTLTRFIPTGSVKVAAKDSETVAYLYVSLRGYPAAIIYIDKQTKPFEHRAYRDAARREQHIVAVFAGRAARAAQKARDAAERLAWVNPYKPGDLFSRSWGYDQTNVNWYEVISSKGKTLVLREIGQLRTDTGNMCGQCVPEPGRYIGDPITCRAQPNSVKVGHHAWARLPNRRSSVASKPMARNIGALMLEPEPVHAIKFKGDRMSSEPEPRPDQYRLPPRFILDCIECDVDIGFYDEGPQLLIDPSYEQLENLRNRAEYYVGKDAPDCCPAGLKIAARALLKRMDALHLPHRFSRGGALTKVIG